MSREREQLLKATTQARRAGAATVAPGAQGLAPSLSPALSMGLVSAIAKAASNKAASLRASSRISAGLRNVLGRAPVLSQPAPQPEEDVQPIRVSFEEIAGVLFVDEPPAPVALDTEDEL